MELKEFINTPAWAQIEQMFLEEIKRMKRDINTRDKDMIEVGRQYVARREAEKIILAVLKRVNRGGTVLKKEAKNSFV